jgi:hypothetical protein
MGKLSVEGGQCTTGTLRTCVVRVGDFAGERRTAAARETDCMRASRGFEFAGSGVA